MKTKLIFKFLIELTYLKKICLKLILIVDIIFIEILYIYASLNNLLL